MSWSQPRKNNYVPTEVDVSISALVIKLKLADEMPRAKQKKKKLTNIVFFTHENWPLLEQLKRSSLVPIFQVYVRK